VKESETSGSLDKFKYWNCTPCYEQLEVDESTWNNHQFVSLDSAGDVIGYIGYQIDRLTNNVYGLNIINF